ncbi:MULTISPECIES: glycosyltransferase family 1 protein [unclassified Rhizobium]|uniref:glycosyltransferase family 4 protein n=1 Tax=unclassified Rhizobium TaxID=2613769 RepID=UPI0006F5BAED|nr:MULTISPECIES: glycosyltransferase family 1 protein [unclassified Rhizobium]KQV44143.1 alpha-mannosyltransferase [Rhizobium sp. Root1212]KRD38324.1 alpha-mannosyltransferase [Rhizobium sp. Root268]
MDTMILVVSDAWHPQVNGVVRTLDELSRTVAEQGADIRFLTPERFATIPLPFYPDIRLALPTRRQVAEEIDSVAPDFIHIATEGPLGLVARRICLQRGLPFTTSYHTRFPEFVSARLPIPESWSYWWLRQFHNSGNGMMVATATLGTEMAARGFRNIKRWTRGIDTNLFNPSRRREDWLPRPIFLNVGRVAVEKNLPAFLDLDLPGSKVVVGDGPDLASLKQRYPDVHFLGRQMGADLAGIYASADVFVFPSRTDTFGNVILEALASGCPVAAFPVTGPRDILADGGGALSTDLRQAALKALDIPREKAREKALTYSWAECGRQFLSNLSRVPKNAFAGRGRRLGTYS